MRSVELAVYADALAGEAASLSACAERARDRGCAGRRSSGGRGTS
jgi:hypothetical protein